MSTNPSWKSPQSIARYVAVPACLMACFASPGVAADSTIQALCSEVQHKMNATGLKTVAVADFTDLQGTATELGRFFAEEVSVGLAVIANDFTVIDRAHLKTLLKEHKLAGTGVIDPATTQEFGKIAGVQALITGSIAPLSDTIRVSVKLLDANTAKILGAWSIDMPRTKAIDDLFGRGIGDTATPPSSRKGNGAADFGNAQALYNQGVILWNAGKIADARRQFEAAVAANPNHAEAHYQLGMALVNDGELARAANEFETYLKLAPTGPNATQAKALAAQLKR